MSPDQVVAYFIGGPFDLTKRVLNGRLPYVQLAEIPDEMVYPYYETDVPNRPVTCKVHIYRLEGSVTDNDGSGRRIQIYNYRGEDR